MSYRPKGLVFMNGRFFLIFVQKWVKKHRFGQKLNGFCPKVGKKIWIWTKGEFMAAIMEQTDPWPSLGCGRWTNVRLSTAPWA